MEFSIREEVIKSLGQPIKGLLESATGNRTSSRGSEQGRDMDSITLAAGRLRTKEQSQGYQLKNLGLKQGHDHSNREEGKDEKVISEAESTESDNYLDVEDKERKKRKMTKIVNLRACENKDRIKKKRRENNGRNVGGG